VFFQEETEVESHDYMDDEGPLTIDESIVDEEPDLPKTPLKASEIQDEILR
jgi:hypothetical protein